MKKYLLKILLYTALLTAVFASVNMGIDPYNIFHYNVPRNNGVEPNKNYIKTEYILHHADRFDSFVFGSSRAGFLDPSLIPNGHYYNMCSSEAVPAEHLSILKVFIRKGIVPKNLFVMIDDITCFVDPALHQTILYRVPYPSGGLSDKVKFYLQYCDLITTGESLKVMREYRNKENAKDADYVTRYQTLGCERLDKDPYYIEGAFDCGYWADYYALRVSEAVEDIKELKELCEQYDINLILVTNPLYEKTYARGVENGYIDFLEALSGVTDFWNFSSFSDITMNEENYYEASHFTPKIAAKMIDTVFGDDPDGELWAQGFGIHVTEENREEFIAFLRHQAKEAGVTVP